MAGPKFSSTDDGRRPTINAFCPVMPKKSMADKTPAEFRRTWRGVEVGFCCDDCVLAWEGFTEDVRERRLAKVLRQDQQLPQREPMDNRER